MNSKFLSEYPERDESDLRGTPETPDALENPSQTELPGAPENLDHAQVTVDEELEKPERSSGTLRRLGLRSHARHLWFVHPESFQVSGLCRVNDPTWNIDEDRDIFAPEDSRGQADDACLLRCYQARASIEHAPSRRCTRAITSAHLSLVSGQNPPIPLTCPPPPPDSSSPCRTSSSLCL